ncbi:hypothetical protein N9C64_02745 [Paracoccaceae bacterium]|jgi:hypothetical protein|nr:hypothetical protein [Paracoccaceae bacterium]
MNKNQEYSQKVFIQIKDIILSSWTTNSPLGSFEELADALTQNGVTNYYGQPYTHWTLRKMIQRMDKVDEESDFRQQHYPMMLHLKDNNIGLKTPTRPAKPIKSRTAKNVDVDEEQELRKLHEEHQYALPPELRGKINFHSSVQSVQ